MISLIVLLFGFLSCISCQIILPESPSQQLLIEQPSGQVTTIPLDTPARLSRGERLTLSTPGFRIGDVNEPIDIIPPAIGNWMDAPEAGQAIQATSINEIHNTNTTNPTNTTHITIDLITNSTNITIHDGSVIARDPWSALTGVNITITPSNQTDNYTSPTWIDIQNEREHQYHGTSSPTMNISLHGNLTSFNLTIHNMTANMTHGINRTDAWILPGMNETEGFITGNITGSYINMSIISSNLSTIITSHPNGTVSIISHGNGTTTIGGDTNITTINPPRHTPDQNNTVPSSANKLGVSIVSMVVGVMVLF